MLAVVGIVYGAVMAFSQTDLKRLVAYTSVSHLGFVLLGIFSWNPLALQGAIMTMICHGLSTGGLFVLVGGLQERIHTRDLGNMGGLWAVAPRLSGAALFFSLASLGLPGDGRFRRGVSGITRLLQNQRARSQWSRPSGFSHPLFMHCAWCSVPSRAPTLHAWRFSDLTPREGLMMAAMIVGLLWLGLYPQPVFNTFAPATGQLAARGADADSRPCGDRR